MLYFLLILFFGSLIGITYMVGRKFKLIQDGQILNINEEEIFSKTPYFEEIKYATIKNTKRHGYILLVITIRIYFRSINFLKKKYREAKTKIREIYQKRQKRTPEEKKEINSFLKMVSEYKNKIRRIKQQVKEEENL